MKELLCEYFLARLIRFLCLRVSANLIVFAINNFYKQLYVKDSECLVEAAIREIAVCSTCQKQSECFAKRDAAGFLT